MRISRNSLAYRIAFAFEDEKPSQVGLCELCWSVILSPMALLFHGAKMAWLYFWGLFIACKPIGTETRYVGRSYASPDGYAKMTLWETYPRWPKIHGIVTRPVYLIGALGGLVFLYVTWKILIGIGAFMLLLFSITAGVEGLEKLYNGLYNAANRKGLCPVVEVK